MEEYLLHFITEVKAISWVQWVSFLSGLLYIYYAAKDNPHCWPWGILSSTLWAYVSWYELKLLSDSILQMIYVILGFVGWYYWSRKKDSQKISVSRTPMIEILWLVIIGIVLTFILGQYTKNHGAAYPYLDAAITVFSVEATILLVREKIENWLAWMVINAVSIPLFYFRGGYLYSVLFIVYLILSFRGWMNWKKIIALTRD